MGILNMVILLDPFSNLVKAYYKNATDNLKQTFLDLYQYKYIPEAYICYTKFNANCRGCSQLSFRQTFFFKRRTIYKNMFRCRDKMLR